MPYPTASGVPSLSGTYIPEIWSSKLLLKFYANTVLSDITNTEYEGEIKKAGDKIFIRTVPDITIRNYVKGQPLVYDQYEGGKIQMDIDRGKTFSFAANLVDIAQADVGFIDKWAEDASRQMKIAIEKDIFAEVYADAASTNRGATAGKYSQNINLGVVGTPRSLTSSNVLDFLVDVGTVLDEQDVPENNRWIVLPPSICALIKKSDLREASFSGDSSNDALRKGRIGMIDRLTIYSSNLLRKVADGNAQVWNVIAGHTYAISFATQLVENETLKNPNDFGTLIRGLQVYGYKTIKPEALVHAYVTIG